MVNSEHKICVCWCCLDMLGGNPRPQLRGIPPQVLITMEGMIGFWRLFMFVIVPDPRDNDVCATLCRTLATRIRTVIGVRDMAFNWSASPSGDLLGLSHLQSILGSHHRWEFPPFFNDHWQSPCAALTAGKCLPWGLCKETVKESINTRKYTRQQQRNRTMMTPKYRFVVKICYSYLMCFLGTSWDGGSGLVAISVVYLHPVCHIKVQERTGIGPILLAPGRYRPGRVVGIITWMWYRV